MQRDLEEQRAFFASRTPVAAKKTEAQSNANANPTTIRPPSGASAHRQQRSSPTASQAAPQQPHVVKGIFERNPSRVNPDSLLRIGSSTGFPSTDAFDAARRRRRGGKSANAKAKTSLFARNRNIRGIQSQSQNKSPPRSRFARERLQQQQQQQQQQPQQQREATRDAASPAVISMGSLTAKSSGQAPPAVYSTSGPTQFTNAVAAPLPKKPPSSTATDHDDGGDDIDMDDIRAEAKRMFDAMSDAEKQSAQQELMGMLSSNAPDNGDVNNGNDRGTTSPSKPTMQPNTSSDTVLFPEFEDGKELHDEASKMFDEMSADEKLAAQQQLLATLPQGIIDMLKQQTPPSSSNNNNDNNSGSNDSDDAEGTSTLDTNATSASKEPVPVPQTSRANSQPDLSSIRSEEELQNVLNQYLDSASPAIRERTQWLQKPGSGSDGAAAASPSNKSHKRTDRAAKSTANPPPQQKALLSSVRFDLDGNIISLGGDHRATAEAEARADNALYHHGGDHNKVSVCMREPCNALLCLTGVLAVCACRFGFVLAWLFLRRLGDHRAEHVSAATRGWIEDSVVHFATVAEQSQRIAAVHARDHPGEHCDGVDAIVAVQLRCHCKGVFDRLSVQRLAQAAHAALFCTSASSNVLASWLYSQVFHPGAVTEGLRAVLALLQIHRDRTAGAASRSQSSMQVGWASDGKLSRDLRTLLLDEGADSSQRGRIRDRLLSSLTMELEHSKDADFSAWRSTELLCEVADTSLPAGSTDNAAPQFQQDDDARGVVVSLLLRANIFSALQQVLAHNVPTSSTANQASGSTGTMPYLMDDVVLEIVMWMVVRMRENTGAWSPVQLLWSVEAFVHS